MLLVVDVGNTNIVIGVMQGADVRHQWRITTGTRTTDEFGMALIQLMKLHDLGASDIMGAAISCVVPSTLYSIEKAVRATWTSGRW